MLERPKDFVSLECRNPTNYSRSFQQQILSAGQAWFFLTLDRQFWLQTVLGSDQIQSELFSCGCYCTLFCIQTFFLKKELFQDKVHQGLFSGGVRDWS